MLDFFKKKNSLSAICDGSIIDITLVPDRVFSQKILGEGFAVIPISNNFVSPVSGIVSDVAATRHAYCITSDDGLEILVHIGIDTVELKGKGFSPLVKSGDSIKQGEPLATVDIDYITKSGYNTTSMIVVTNSDRISNFSTIETPSAKAGDRAFLYKI